MSKKYKLAYLLFLTLTVFLTGRSYYGLTQAAFSFSVNQKVVLIDAGHGGWELGVCS